MEQKEHLSPAIARRHLRTLIGSFWLLVVLMLVHELRDVAGNFDEEVAALDDHMLVELGCAVDDFLAVRLDEFVLAVKHLLVAPFLGVNV